ncbi:unnamed protein product [Lathyrus sativus]|nr:unnamed protein product [Lathyrus sativus]
MGHKCEDRGKKQQWKPKLKPPEIPMNTMLVKPPETSTNITPVISPEREETIGTRRGSWTRARKSVRDKGKNIMTDTYNNINCNNGFDALEVLNDHEVTINSEPC